MKKIGLTDMKGLEEVNIFTDDFKVIHITNPKSKQYYFDWFLSPKCASKDLEKLSKQCFASSIYAVQASIPSNTYVVSGTVETKRLEDLLPGILNQLGPESMGRLREYAASSMENGQIEEDDEEDDDDVPDLVENFEEAAAK